VHWKLPPAAGIALPLASLFSFRPPHCAYRFVRSLPMSPPRSGLQMPVRLFTACRASWRLATLAGESSDILLQDGTPLRNFFPRAAQSRGRTRIHTQLCDLKALVRGLNTVFLITFFITFPPKGFCCWGINPANWPISFSLVTPVHSFLPRAKARFPHHLPLPLPSVSRTHRLPSPR